MLTHDRKPKAVESYCGLGCIGQQDLKQNHRMMQESVQIMEMVWKGEAFDYKGEFWSAGGLGRRTHPRPQRGLWGAMSPRAPRRRPPPGARTAPGALVDPSQQV